MTYLPDTLPVCVVVVSFNRADDLMRCLASLARLDPPVRRVMVVDNGSTDGTLGQVQHRHPWVELFSASGNLGPCLARNAAVAACTEPIIWFLDSDTEAVSPDAAARLFALFDDPELGGAGGEAVLDQGGAVAGVKRLWLTPSALVQGESFIAPASTIAPFQVAPCSVIASCNLMLRRRDFVALGGFDPFYFFFYEDMDLTWRLHRRGRQLCVLTPMPVVHRYSESVRIRRLWIEARNRMYFCLKNLPWRTVLLLPLHDLAFVLRAESLTRLLRRARQPADAVSLVTLPDPEARPGTAAMAGKAVRLVLRILFKILLAYAALPVVLGPALAARRRPTAGLAADGLITRRAAP